MNPSEMLKQLLTNNQPQTSTGIVSRVEGRSVYLVESGRIRVATSLPGDVSIYSPGDVVKIEGGILVGKAAPRRSKYIYL
jgi:hypothetical protein